MIFLKSLAITALVLVCLTGGEIPESKSGLPCEQITLPFTD